MPVDASNMFCFSLIVSILWSTATGDSLVRLQIGNQYIYQYHGNTKLSKTGEFAVESKFGIYPVLKEEIGLICDLRIYGYRLHVNNHTSYGTMPGSHRMDFSKLFAFAMLPHGEIRKVFYEKNEDLSVLFLKKALINVLSARLHADNDGKEDSSWQYQVNETGHMGDTMAHYVANRKSGNIIFHRKFIQEPLVNGRAETNKTIFYHSGDGVIGSVDHNDVFYMPKRASPNFDHTEGLPGGKSAETHTVGDNVEVPHMGGTSKGRLVFQGTRRAEGPIKLDFRTLKNDTLTAHHIPREKLPLVNLFPAIRNNVTCILQIQDSYSKELLHCFNNIVNMIAVLSTADKIFLAKTYLDPNNSVSWNLQRIMMDAIGTEKSGDSLTILAKFILNSTKPDGKLILNALTHFVALKERPEQMVLDVLFTKAFNEPYTFKDKDLEEQVNDRTVLILAAIAKKMRTIDPKWAETTVARIHTELGYHDPYHYRGKRSPTDPNIQFSRTVTRKATLLHCLGNAGFEESFSYLTSYVNDSTTPSIMRHSALMALGNIHLEEATDSLLLVGLGDRDHHIRRTAVVSYMKNPSKKSGVVFNMTSHVWVRDPGVVLRAVDKIRSRRSKAMDVIAAIWKGFNFELQVPGVNWRKQVGTEKFGASFGLILENDMKLKISPLKGYFVLNMFDTAYATAHLGIIGFNLHIVKAEVCFKGEVRYGLNIFAEQDGPTEVIKLIKNFKKNLFGIVETMKNAINNFKKLKSQYPEPEKMFDTFIQDLKNMPSKVSNLTTGARNLIKKMELYTNMPPEIKKVKAFIQRLTKLFQSIKSDVMNFYNSVVDAVVVVLPWAAEQIKKGFDLIINAFKKITQNPKTSIGDIRKGVTKIGSAVLGITLTARNIRAACFFTKGERPYWFDMEIILRQVSTETTEVFQILRSLDSWVKEGVNITGLNNNTKVNINSPNEFGLSFTGKTSAKMRAQVIKEMRDLIEDTLSGPTAALTQLAEPFILSYNIIRGVFVTLKVTYYTVKEVVGNLTTIIVKLFGKKAHSKFSRTFMTSDECWSGFYPSTGNGIYGNNTGVDLIHAGNRPVYAPFSGTIRKSARKQVTIATKEIRKVDVIIDNVRIFYKLKIPGGVKVAKGELIGYASTSACYGKNHLHLSLKKRESGKFIDPSRYLEKRAFQVPTWIESCNHYFLILMGIVIQQGKATKPLKKSNDFTGIPPEPDTSGFPPVNGDNETASNNTEAGGNNTTLKEKLKMKAEKFFKKFKLKNLAKYGPSHRLKVAKMKVKDMFKVLKEGGKGYLYNKTKQLLGKLKNLIEKNFDACDRPDFMDDRQLRTALTQYGVKTELSREEMIKIYLKKLNICGYVANTTRGIFCRFQEDCLRVDCCLDLKYQLFLAMLNGYLIYEPCPQEVTIGLKYESFDWNKTYDISYALKGFSETLPLWKLKVFPQYIRTRTTYTMKVMRNGMDLNVTFTLNICDEFSDKCFKPLHLFNSFIYPLSFCSRPKRSVSQGNASANETGGETGFDDDSLESTLKKLDERDINNYDLLATVNEVRDTYKTMLRASIENSLSDVYENAFEKLDLCLPPKEIEFGPNQIKFFSFSFNVMAGPIPLSFEFGSNGAYGFTTSAGACLMSFKVTGRAMPSLGLVVYGGVGLDIFIFLAQLRLVGFLLNTNFPIKAEITFSEFPLKLKARMDLVFIPLILRLHLRLVLKFRIGFIKVEKELINQLLWHYQMPAIRKNIFNLNNLEADTSPPVIVAYAAVEPLKRAARTSKCSVAQVDGQDYTEPEFNLEFGAVDDRSELTFTFSVGTYQGGNDVLKDELLGGNSIIGTQRLPPGIPLYFTVTATNNNGLKAYATCVLSSYDVTPPMGRVTLVFTTTSNPNKIIGSIVALDESAILEEKIAVGVGKGLRGDQLVPWIPQNTKLADSRLLHSSPLKKFSEPRVGRLDATIIRSLKADKDVMCASECLKQNRPMCYSFNLDHGESQTCELMHAIENPYNELHQTGHYHNYERLGVGKTAELKFDNLVLIHNQIYYLNLFLNNSLGYTTVASSSGLLADFTPPENTKIKVGKETIERVPCETLVLWTKRCKGQSNLNNHRKVIDAPGSKGIFNGPEWGKELLYTRANTVAEGNWDGFVDKESGILGYMWSVGTQVCGNETYGYKDPHSHFTDASDWTHTGVAYPLNLDDGQYFLTVRALSKVDYGGPMALTVCHTQHFVVDTSPPLLHVIKDVGYNETTYEVSGFYNISDPHSGIKSVKFGLGLTQRDVGMMPWRISSGDNSTFLFTFKIKDGVLAWIRICIVNHAELLTSGYASPPIIIDTTEPVAGVVYDGDVVHHDLKYQANGTHICSSWANFDDPHTGISKYQWCVGTAPNNCSILPYQNVVSSKHQTCAPASLIHNTVYYSTIVAFNNALYPKYNQSSSDGVLYDETQPLQGSVQDGLDTNADLKYSSSAATISANWNGFSDPESGIVSYTVTVLEKHNTVGEDFKEIQTPSRVGKTINFFSWHHFHLHHRDVIKVRITAVNGAKNQKSAISNGFLIDLTNPVLIHLVDGLDPKTDKQLTSSLTTLSASFNFEDPDSDIAIQQVQVYETFLGTRRQIFPTGNGWATLSVSAQSWTQDGLSLQNGGVYSIRVMAKNKAELSSVRDTDGVLVDSTPPKINVLNVGVFSGESEEVVDGFVLTTDRNGIKASWMASDPESGISRYLVAVGTAPGNPNIVDFHDVGDVMSAYIKGFTLNLTDEVTNKPVYYVIVKAENKAGILSAPLHSSQIKVLAADKEGIVIDGGMQCDSDCDVDYQLDGTTVSMQFNGFESIKDGIANYEWAVGSAPLLGDVQPFTAEGLVLGNNDNNKGISSFGRAQSILPLAHGQTVYVTVRAHTYGANTLEAASDGITVDQTAPKINITNVDAFPDFVSASWESKDGESDIKDTFFSFGTHPGGSDLFATTILNETSSRASVMVRPIVTGKPNILTVVSLNNVGLEQKVSHSGVVVDITNPVAGTVLCPSYGSEHTAITCTWSGFRDPESGIQSYKFGLSLYEGKQIGNVTSLNNEVTKFVIADPRNYGMKHLHKYVAVVVASNKYGLEVSSYSSLITIDSTPPVPGKIIELNSIDTFNVSSGVHERTKLQCETKKECTVMDAACQPSVTRMEISWEPFTDPESAIAKYEIGIGTVPGGTQLRNFEKVDESSRHLVINNLDLSQIPGAYATMRVTNGAGNTIIRSSNGVFISQYSGGLSPVKPFRVFDGPDPKKDYEYQDNNEFVEANWDFSGDPCPVTEYWWSVIKLDGTQMLNWTKLAPGTKYAVADGFQLKDGETIFTLVKAVNLLNVTTVVRSNGIVAKLEPTLPGYVMDGNIIGFDLNTQPSITTLAANWDGFGQEAQRTSSVSVGGEVRKVGSHQIIEFYEVAIGTGKQPLSAQTNVRPFVNVGTNKLWTFKDLQLVPRQITYYITVRAISKTGSKAMSTSNGIKVGIGGKILGEGKVNVPRYISSTNTLSASWKNFLFEFPIFFYQWGIGNNTQKLLNGTNCQNLQNFGKDTDPAKMIKEVAVFNILPLSNVGKDTYVHTTKLSLTHGSSYDVVVIATDESATCQTVFAKTTVDTTPPVDGKTWIGEFPDAKSMYTTRSDSLRVQWSGFKDDESGIPMYKVGLYQGPSCPSTVTSDLIRETETINVPGNETEYSFFGLKLSNDRPYYATVTAVNGAGLEKVHNSMPILVDLNNPVAGTVVDGIVFNENAEFQYSTENLAALFMFKPSFGGEDCPRKPLKLNGTNKEWNTITGDGVAGITPEEKITFTAKKLKFHANDGVDIELFRDPEKKRMVSGGLYTTAEIGDGGIYTMEMKAANGSFRAVTSVVFWDQTVTRFGDFDPNLELLDFVDDFDITANISKGNETARENQKKVDPKSTKIPSFGIQIHPGAVVNNRRFHVALLWSCKVDAFGVFSPQVIGIPLNFDPSTDWHKYEIRISKIKKNKAESEMEMELYIDGVQKIRLSDLPSISSQAALLLGLRTRSGFLPEVDDFFNPPKTTASFRKIIVPPQSNLPCRYVLPFKPGDYPVVELSAAVGTRKFSDDVAPYTAVVSPCIPCAKPCDVFVCNASCPLQENKLLVAELKNLNLSAKINDSIVTYFVTVRAMSGSGRYATAVTDGVVIDTTPPQIEILYHVDLAYSKYEPSDAQGNNNSLAIRWFGRDNISTIVEYFWAIGSLPFGSDIQDFQSVGMATFASNTSLSLENEKTYYGTVRAFNGAGMNSTNTTKGIKIKMVSPKVDDVQIGFGNSPPSKKKRSVSGKQKPDKVVQNGTDEFKVGWSNVPAGTAVIKFKLGTAPGKDDLVPEMQVGIDSPGIVVIKNSGIYINDQKVANLSEMHITTPANVQQSLSRKKRAENDGSGGSFEPGRTLYGELSFCNEGHRCSRVKLPKIILVRKTDTVITAKAGEAVKASLSGTDWKVQLEIKNMPAGSALLAGKLTDEDFKKTYLSDSSSSSKTFLVNPLLTAESTERELRKRIINSTQIDFYLSTGSVQLNGSVGISVKMASQNCNVDFKPQLLYWHIDSQQWRLAARSCTASQNDTFDCQAALLKVQVCNTQRKKDEDNWFSKDTQFSVQFVANAFYNEPPSFVGPSSVTIQEDSGTNTFQVAANDPDADAVAFYLQPQVQNSLGVAQLSANGSLTYTPNKEVYGEEVLHVIVRETGDHGRQPLSTSDSINITIQAIPDKPILSVSFDSDAKTLHTKNLVIPIRKFTGVAKGASVLTALVVSCDVDTLNTNKFLIERPRNGTLMVSKIFENFVWSSQRCSEALKIRGCRFDKAIKKILSTNSTGAVPKPCHLTLPAERHRLTMVVIEYLPERNFLGSEVIKIISVDNENLRSDVVTMTLVVNHKPCLNETRSSCRSAPCGGCVENCINVKTGWYASCRACRYFVVCIEGWKYEFACPLHYIWNDKRKMCADPSVVDDCN